MQKSQPDVWELSCNAQGSRAVQKWFDHGSNEHRLRLVEPLRGHVWEALRCPHANHVIQKCITALRPRDFQFIIDELLETQLGAAVAARHRFGCRIVQRLIEHCSAEQVCPLIDDLLADAVALCSHNYGNYVMQHILEHSSSEHKLTLCRMLEPHAATLGADFFACAVLGKALCHGCPKDQSCIAQALLDVPGLLVSMAHTKNGHITAKLVLQLAEVQQVHEAQNQIVAAAETLRGSRYGRSVISYLDQQDLRGSQWAGKA